MKRSSNFSTERCRLFLAKLRISRLSLSTTTFRLTAKRRTGKLLLAVPDNVLTDKLNAVINR